MKNRLRPLSKVRPNPDIFFDVIGKGMSLKDVGVKNQRTGEAINQITQKTWRAFVEMGHLPLEVEGFNINEMREYMKKKGDSLVAPA